MTTTTTRRIEPGPDNTADVFRADHQPVLFIDPGDVIEVGTLDASGHLARPDTPGAQTPRLIPDARGHCLTGPLAVRGARAGDMIAVKLIKLSTGDWGFTVAGGRESPICHRLDVAGPSQASWLLWDLDPTTATATETRGFSRAIAPFLGVIGVAPAESGDHSTIPPRATAGGNIDCRELVAGSTLYLPVCVDDALLYLGDGHAAQGDGEVGGTAIECAMRTVLSVDLATDRPLSTIHAETPSGLITFGFDADLNAATGDALDAMISWMQSLYDLDRSSALALASVSVDLRVTQVANVTWGVHAVLPTDLLTRTEGGMR